MGKYVKKTNRRRQEDRELSVRAELHDPPDYQKLTELLIRLSLRQSRTSQEQPSTERRASPTEVTTSS
ncbi:hypothetical protein BJF85_24470 [Saccharomonospora sp. CUA-673]|uniref:hypothetical protein n=1 Tax=Saccharomonospora sp. CUA-673 TaxID=1904969 RepID=UPI00095DDFBF|nr:hypothetical protein [Saccharomonospora sp. CUA-673]OLT41178.1 hypothetical protein BJF85_24470 [Saccharomonospora sp. CUA-673]